MFFKKLTLYIIFFQLLEFTSNYLTNIFIFLIHLKTLLNSKDATNIFKDIIVANLRFIKLF